MAGQTYQLEFNSNLSSGTWTNLGNAVIATNGTASALDAPPPDPRRFDRVVLLQ